MSSHGTIVDGLGDEVTIAALVVAIFISLIIGCCFKRVSIRDILRSSGRGQSNTTEESALSEGLHIARRHYSADRCPICFNGFILALETCCGHMFCGQCLRQYFVVTNFLMRILTCPICREEITTVFICFTEEEMASEDEEFCEERDDIRDVMLEYNRNYSGAPHTISQYCRHLLRMMNHLWQEFTSLAMILRVRMILYLVVGIIYVIVPIDLFPEAVFGVMGLLDDVLVFSVVIVIIINNYRNLVVNRLLND